jgi:hypothetical protein
MSLLNSRRFAPDMRMAIVHTVTYFERHPGEPSGLGGLMSGSGADSEVAIGTLAGRFKQPVRACSKIRSFICCIVLDEKWPEQEPSVLHAFTIHSPTTLECHHRRRPVDGPHLHL